MNVILFGRNLEVIEPLVKKAGFKIVKKNPDFIISYGGDGTLMQSEHEFPGIPKIILKGSLICKKASCHGNEVVLAKVKRGDYETIEYFKLEAVSGDKKITAVNDVVLHNKNARHAIRYRVWINGKEIRKDVIGDGAIIATPFGSTAYYRSITGSFFELGIGLAFNNSTEQFDHMVLKEDSQIKIKIIRGPAVIYGDNQEESMELLIDEEVVIKKTKKSMKVICPL